MRKGTGTDAAPAAPWQSSPVAARREIEAIEAGVRGGVIVALACLGLAGCDEPAPSATAHARSAAPEHESEPPRAPRTLPHGPDDACATTLAEETPERVRSTLHTIGYDDVFHDTCLAERAERDHDGALCAQIALPSLARSCMVHVAVRSAQPRACPTGIDGALDPLCVALAARDRRLCAAAGLVDRAVCEEALGREHRCNHLPDEVRADCDARGAALAALVTGDITTSPPFAVALEVQIDGEATPMSASAIERGATIDWNGCSPVLHVGDAESLALPFGGGGLAMEARVDAPIPTSVPVGAILAGDVGATLELAPPRGRRARASSGTIRMQALELALGGAVAGRFEATLSGSDTHVEGTFHTFVRDLAPRPEACDSLGPAAVPAGEGEGAP